MIYRGHCGNHNLTRLAFNDCVSSAADGPLYYNHPSREGHNQHFKAIAGDRAVHTFVRSAQVMNVWRK